MLISLMIVNRQSKVRIDMHATREFVKKLRKCLRLGRREFNICFVGDREMSRLNATYRGKVKSTDVLSFPWGPARGGSFKSSVDEPRSHIMAARRANPETFEPGRNFPEIFNFLGDIVISTEMARRNASEEGHSTLNEIRWLILHGVLHLLGFDHASDRGEMATLELALRARLGI